MIALTSLVTDYSCYGKITLFFRGSDKTWTGLWNGFWTGLNKLLIKSMILRTCDFLSLPPSLYQYSDSATVIIFMQGIITCSS